MHEQYDDELRSRAEFDAAVIASLLDASQRVRSAGTSDEETAAQNLAGQRLEVLRTAPEPTPGEFESAQAALAQDDRAQHAASTKSAADCSLLVLGTVFLVAGGLGLLLNWGGGLVIGAITLALAVVAMAVQAISASLYTRRRLIVLLEWATLRDNQLARGLPPVGETQGATLWRTKFLNAVGTLLGGIGLFFLAVTFFVSWPELRKALAEQRLPGWDDLAVSPFFVIAGVVMAALGVLLFVVIDRIEKKAERRALAMRWLPTFEYEDDSEEEEEEDDSDEARSDGDDSDEAGEDRAEEEELDRRSV